MDTGPPPPPWHWQFFGACRDADEALFFHPPGERGSTRRRRDAMAKSICASCPVMLVCREQSLRAREPFGVWGGLSEVERGALLAAELLTVPLLNAPPLDAPVRDAM